MAYNARPYVVQREIKYLQYHKQGDSRNRPLYFTKGSVEIDPVILEGAFIRLSSMSLDHLDSLCDAGLDERLWRVTITVVRNREDMRHYVEGALRLQEDGSTLPFVIIDKAANAIVGSTRYLNIDKGNRRLEIGSTWISPRWQKTYVNTESKYLMLRLAFEILCCIRVEFKTDSLNEQSRKALIGIGAKEEGILRNHMITQSGRIRHSVYYSIIDSEWPEVKKRLQGWLQGNVSSGS